MADTFRDLVGCVLDTAIDCFGETVRYCPLGSAQVSIIGVYDDRFEQVDVNTEQVISSQQPTLGIKLADLGNCKPQKGDTVIRQNGQKFRVVESIEDGHGGAMLVMHETKI